MFDKEIALSRSRYKNVNSCEKHYVLQERLKQIFGIRFISTTWSTTECLRKSASPELSSDLVNDLGRV